MLNRPKYKILKDHGWWRVVIYDNGCPVLSPFYGKTWQMCVDYVKDALFLNEMNGLT